MKSKVPEFIQNATNVYRTKDYIVKQVIGIQYGCEEHNVVYSRDTYYKRTPEGDREYEILYCWRRNIDVFPLLCMRGRTNMYARTYKT